MSLFFLLSDDIGGFISITMVFGFSMAFLFCLLIYHFTKGNKTNRIIISLVGGLVIFCIAVWAVINLMAWVAG